MVLSQLPKNCVIFVRLPTTINVENPVQVHSVLGMTGGVVGTVGTVPSCTASRPRCSEHCITDCDSFQELVLLRTEGSQLASGQSVEIGVRVKAPRAAGHIAPAGLVIASAVGGVTIAIQEIVQLGTVVAAGADGATSLPIITDETYVFPRSLVAGGTGYLVVRSNDRFGNMRTAPLDDISVVSVQFVGTSTGTASVMDLQDGRFAVSFQATAAGTYSLSVSIQSVQISGSPFTATLIASNLNSQNSDISFSAGFSLGIVGVAKALTVIGRDAYGNLVPSSSGESFEVIATLASSGQNYLRASTVTQRELAIVFTSSGRYVLSVLLQDDSGSFELIGGSQTVVTMNAGLVSASASSVLNNYGKEMSVQVSPLNSLCSS
jgi:hypothetical protein